MAVQFLDSLVGMFAVAHLDEPEATGPPGVTVGDQFDFLDLRSFCSNSARTAVSSALKGKLPTYNLVPISRTPRFLVRKHYLRFPAHDSNNGSGSVPKRTHFGLGFGTAKNRFCTRDCDRKPGNKV